MSADLPYIYRPRQPESILMCWKQKSALSLRKKFGIVPRDGKPSTSVPDSQDLSSLSYGLHWINWGLHETYDESWSGCRRL